jgi:hypothetical protein
MFDSCVIHFVAYLTNFNFFSHDHTMHNWLCLPLDSFHIDIAVSPDTYDSPRPTKECYWNALGVDTDDSCVRNSSRCSTNEAIVLKVCTVKSDHGGQLFINETLLIKGRLQTLSIDALGKQDVYITILQNAINEGSKNHDFFVALYYIYLVVSELLL